jgi:hypothetical protein
MIPYGTISVRPLVAFVPPPPIIALDVISKGLANKHSSNNLVSEMESRRRSNDELSNAQCMHSTLSLSLSLEREVS